jgi:hypothetical protein
MAFIDDLVSLDIVVSSAAVARAVLNVPLLLCYHTKPWRTKSYGSRDELIDDGFTINDPVYKMASALAAQNPHPKSFKVGRRATAPTQKFRLTPKNFTVGYEYKLVLTSPLGVKTTVSYTVTNADSTPVDDIVEAIRAAIDPLPDISASGLTGTKAAAVQSTDGTFNIPNGAVLNVNIDGTALTITSVDADYANPAAATAAEVAAVLNNPAKGGLAGIASVVGLKVQLDSLLSESDESRVNVTGGSMNTPLQFPTTNNLGTDDTYVECTAGTAGKLWDLDLMALDPVSDLVFSDVTVDPGIAADLAAIKLVDSAWYGLALDSNSPAEIAAAAAWIEGERKVFCTNTSDGGCADSNVVNDIMSTLKTSGYTRTLCLYSAAHLLDYRGLAWLSEQIVKDASKTSNWAFKTLAGIATDALKYGQQTAVLNKNGNTYTSEHARSITFEGKSSSGQYFDVAIFVDWLYFRIQEDVFSVLVSNDRIPYTDAGVALLTGAVEGVLIQGIGTAQSPGGLAADPAPVVIAPKVADVAAADRAARRFPSIEFQGQLSGAINGLTISGKVSV